MSVPDEPMASLTVAQAIEVWKILEEVVVSLDQIAGKVDDPLLGALATDQYVGEGGAWRRLSRARQVMSDVLDCDLGSEAVDALAEDIEYWRYSSKWSGTSGDVSGS